MITMPALLLPEKPASRLEKIEEIKAFDSKTYQRYNLVLVWSPTGTMGPSLFAYPP